ncbi:uncharacterized protein LOC144118742 [Amblyomma americanum]
MARRQKRVRFTLPDGRIVFPQSVDLTPHGAIAQPNRACIGEKRGIQEVAPWMTARLRTCRVSIGEYPFMRFKRSRSPGVVPGKAETESDTSLGAGDASSYGAFNQPTGPNT